MNEILVGKRATANESYQLTGICAELEAERGHVAIDARECEMMGPLGVAMLAASAAIRHRDGRASSLLVEGGSAVAEFIEEVGLDRFVRGETTGLGTLEVRQLEALNPTYSQAVAELVLDGVSGFTEDDTFPIQLCLNELQQNVFEWSQSPVGCTVHCRWYRNTGSVRMAVVDRGIGIPAALRRQKVEGLHRADDAWVIEAAVTKPRLTSRENKVGGLGLKTIRETVCERGGSLTVLSLGAKLRWSGDKCSRFRAKPFRGTAIEIDFRPGQPCSRDPGPSIF